MAYNPFRDGKQTQSTQTGRVNPFRQTSADRSDRERVMRNWQSDAEQHGILNNPQYTDEGKAYQQMAQEYAKYGTQYQNQLKQGMTGRQWAADVNKRLEELQAQQRAAKAKNRPSGVEDPSLWVTTTEQYDALPDAMSEYRQREASRKADSDAYDKQLARLLKEKEWADYFADAGLSGEAGYKVGSARGKAAYESADAATARKRIDELEQRLVALNQNSGWASTVEQSDEIERERNAIQQELESLGAGYKNAQQADYTMSRRNGVRDNWTDEERSNFYYLYNDNKDEAQAYARRINDRYAYSDAQAEKEKVGEWASQNFWTGLAGTAASVGLTMTSLADTLDRTKEYAATGDISAKSGLTPADIGMAMTSAIASSLNEKSGTINDNVWVIGGKGLGDLYETGVSILNSLASVYMLGGVGTYANFFGQASKTAYEEGIQRGLSVDKALTYGYASGVAEVAGEMFSIEHLIKMKNPSSLKGIIKNIFVQGGIEASEESATTLMNTISDAIINGDKSELASNYYALMQAGYSPADAEKLVIADWTQGVMYDALGGFVSGVASAGVHSTVQGSMTYKGDAQELIDYAKSEGSDTAAAKRAQKYEDRVKSGKRMTNYQAGTLTELAQEAVVSKDLDNIREAVGKRLSALGENSSALTEAVVRQAVQQEAKAADISVPKVTEKQRGLIQNSKAAKRVLSEMDIGNMRMETAAELSGHDNSQYQRSNEWARDIGTRIIAPGEYGVRSTNTVTAEEKRADVKVGDESGKVVGFKNGMARVEVTENGKSTIREVKPDDVQQLPKQTRRLFDEISRYDGDTQAAMYAAYMPGQDIEAYVQAADTAMNLYGAQTKATLEQARSFGKATFRMLSDAQLDALMQAGRKLADQRKAAAERTGESKGEVKQGKVSYDGGEADGRKLKAPSKEAIDRMSDAEKTLAKALTATGVNVVFYESEANAEGRYSGAQGMYYNGTVYLDVNAGMNSVESGQRTIVLTAAHEMTHFIRENSEAGYIALREFITDRLMQQGLDIEELVTQKRARESRELSYDEAVEEVIADACETVLTEPTAIRQLASDNMPLAKKIRKWLNDFFRKIKNAFAGLEAVHDEAKAMTDYMDELRAMWDDALSEAVRNRANKNAAENGDVKMSVREIERDGVNYGIGVYLDSTLLENLTDKERVQMVKERVRELGGQSFTAYDNSGNTVSIKIAESSEHFKNKNGKKVSVTKDLATKYSKNRIKQESVVLADELITTAKSPKESAPRYSHGWLDNYGKNKWEQWTSYIQDKSGNVWAATLHVANATDGLKYLYDIDPIKAVNLAENTKKVGQRGTSRNSLPAHNITDSAENVNTKIKKSEREITQERGKRRAEIYSELQRLKDERSRLLEQDADYAAAQEKRRYATTFRERVDATHALNAAKAKIDTAELDERIQALQDERSAIDEAERAEYNAEKEKYSGAKTRGYAELPDTRTAELDEKYNDAVKRGNKKETQALVLEAAERAMSASVVRDKGGKLLPVYHWTNASFNSFDRSYARTGNEMDGFFFAPDAESTREYGDNAVRAYLNITNPAYDPYLDRTHEDSGTLLRERLAYEGYDGVIRTENGKIVEYMAFDPEQIKSAEPVVYDDNGKVIPLSERFNSKSRDIRYSMRDVTVDDTREELAQRRAAYARLERENAALKARVDYLKGQTKLTKEATVRESDVAKYARSILKEYTSRADSAEIQQQLQELGNYIVQNDARVLSYDEIRSRAEDIAETVLDNAHAVIAEEMPGLGEYKEFLGNTALKVSDNTLNDLPEGFRKEYSGKIKLRADGRSVDSVWMELQEMYGEGEFPSNIYAQSDMLEIMADKFSTWQAIEGNPFYNYMGEAIQSLTNDIMDMVLGADIRQTAPTYADRAAAKLARERAKGAEAVAAERERGSARAERLQAMLESERERRREEVAREKADKWAAVGSVREYYQSMIKRQRAERAESADRGKYRAQVEKRTKELSDWLLANSDKQHVPEVLKKTIGDFLATLDFTSRRALDGGTATQKDARFQQRLSALQELLRKQAAALEENSDADTFAGYLDIDGDTMDALAQLVQDVNVAIGSDRTWTVNRMNAADLARLDQVLKVLQHSVKNMNKLLANAHFKSSIEAAQNTMTRMDALKTNRKYAGKVKDFFAWDNVTPVYAFRRFGDGGKAIFDSFTRGWDKMAFNMRTIYDYAENAYTADEVRAWEKDIREVELSTGKKVRIPVSAIMELYVSAKQEQAMNHLNGGGLRVSDFKDGRATVNQTEHYLMTAEDIAAITGELSDRQRAVADALQRFAAGTGAAWGNEVSMKRFGYRAFTEESYWPIATDDNTRDAIDPQARANDMYRLLNMSMTKGRNAKANNALVVGSIFDTFSAHMADMAKYNALALPVLDAMKWYNYREKETLSTGQIKTASVQGAIEGAYGRGANNYIVTLMKDINGKQELGRGEDLPRKMISNYKVASVAANVRVALLQPTSYVRAGMELDPKYLAKGALIKGGVQEMMKYSGTAIWKDFGGYDTNISRNIRDQIKHDATVGEQIKEKSMVLAELGDRLTWGALWNACKLEVQDKQHLSGEELMQATANRFREVIYLTQVMDSTLTRSHNMRSKSTYASLATAFMSEPTLSYSMVQDAFMDYMDEHKISKNGTAAWQKTRGKLVKALGIYAMSAAASAIIESLWDAFRDDDDYETLLEKILEAMFGTKEGWFLDGNLIGDLRITTKLPLVKDIVSMFDGYSNDRMDTAWAANLVKAYKIWKETIDLATGKLDKPTDATYNGKMTWYGKLYNTLKPLSQMTGFAIANLTRDVSAIWNTTFGAWTGKKLRTYYPGVKTSVKYAYQDGYLTAEEAEKILINEGVAEDKNDVYFMLDEWDSGKSSYSKYGTIKDAAKAGDKAAYKSALKDLTDHGITEKNAQSAIRSALKEWYQGTEDTPQSVSKQDTIKKLQEFAGMSKADAEAAVLEWTCKIVTGVEYSDIKTAYLDGDVNAVKAKQMLMRYGGLTSEEADKRVQNYKFEEQYGFTYSRSNVQDEYIRGSISEATAKTMLTQYGGKTDEEAERSIQAFNFLRSYPEYDAEDITEAQIAKYYESVDGSGVSVREYVNYASFIRSTSADVDADGNAINGSKMRKVMEYIDSLNLTSQQKDVLFLTQYAKSSLRKTPWH